jgi:hypothetical protein
MRMRIRFGELHFQLRELSWFLATVRITSAISTVNAGDAGKPVPNPFTPSLNHPPPLPLNILTTPHTTSCGLHSANSQALRANAMRSLSSGPEVIVSKESGVGSR